MLEKFKPNIDYGLSEIKTVEKDMLYLPDIEARKRRLSRLQKLNHRSSIISSNRSSATNLLHGTSSKSNINGVGRDGSPLNS